MSIIVSSHQTGKTSDSKEAARRKQRRAGRRQVCVAALASTHMPTGQTPPVMLSSPRMLSFTFMP